MIDIYAQIENNVKQFVMEELAKAKKAITILPLTF